MQVNPQIQNTLSKSEVFRILSSDGLKSLSSKCRLIKLSTGKALIRPNLIEKYSYLIISGEVRLLALNPFKDEPFTIAKVQNPSLLGLIDLLRQEPCEIAMASSEVTLLEIPHDELIRLIQVEKDFREGLDSIYSPCEGAYLLGKQLASLNPPPKYPEKWIRQQLENSDTKGEVIKNLLSSRIQGYEHLIGQEVTEKELDKFSAASYFPIRVWQWYVNDKESKQDLESSNLNNINNNTKIGKIDHSEEFDLAKLASKNPLIYTEIIISSIILKRKS